MIKIIGKGQQGSSSFLKKRTKKLLLLGGGTEAQFLARPSEASSKSFLVLFFKKEILPSHLPSSS